MLSRIFSHANILAFLLVCSVAINILLALEVRSVRAYLVKLEADIEYDKGLLIGEKSPNLTAFDENNIQNEIIGDKINLPTILYIFTPDCPFCIKNLANIKTIFANPKDKYRFIAVSLRADNLSNYSTENNIPFQIYHSPPKDVFRSFKMGKTPQTYVFSKDGYVIANWSGFYSGDEKFQVEEFFGIKLPEIKDTPKGD
jgi:thioredoxin-related protein